MPSPTAPMSPKEAAAYTEALQEIEACRKFRWKSLELSHLGLSTLPPEIGQLTALTELHLWGNELSTLPPEIVQLTALTELYLSGNQLSTLPPVIGQLTALTVLFLSGNQLSTLPPEIGELTALTELYLSNNQLSTLPPQIGRLTKLRHFDVRGNPLGTIPKELIRLIDRTSVDLPQLEETEKSSRRFCWHSTEESVSQGRVSALAILETLCALGLVLLLSKWFDTAAWLAGAVCLAPFMLLRTPHSTRFGVRFFKWCQQITGGNVNVLAFLVMLVVVGVAIWKIAWWWGICLLLFPGPLIALVMTPALFCVRFIAMLSSFLRHPLQSLASIPRNWQRVVLATDSMTAPEFLPGWVVRDNDSASLTEAPFRPWGPNNFLRRHGRTGDRMGRWIYWTSFPFLYLCTVAYRWSVKATSIVYLPLIWIVRRGSVRPKDLRQEAEDLLVDPLARLRRWLAVVVLAGFACKLEWFLFSEGFTEGWEASRGLKFLRAYIVPHAIPLWQVASALNALLALALGYGAWWVAHRIKSGRPPQESTVLGWWKRLRVLSAVLVLYTISCAFLIAMKEGDLWQRISEAVDLRPLP